jgi:hypothetical protein
LRCGRARGRGRRSSAGRRFGGRLCLHRKCTDERQCSRQRLHCILHGRLPNLIRIARKARQLPLFHWLAAVVPSKGYDIIGPICPLLGISCACRIASKTCFRVMTAALTTCSSGWRSRCAPHRSSRPPGCSRMRHTSCRTGCSRSAGHWRPSWKGSGGQDRSAATRPPR